MCATILFTDDPCCPLENLFSQPFVTVAIGRFLLSGKVLWWSLNSHHNCRTSLLLTSLTTLNGIVPSTEVYGFQMFLLDITYYEILAIAYT